MMLQLLNWRGLILDFVTFVIVENIFCEIRFLYFVTLDIIFTLKQIFYGLMCSWSLLS